jgi:hypothetical protein
MVKINVDEAYALDYLSILFLKKNRSDECLEAWENCYDDLSLQISNFQEIIASQEYINLLEANQITFTAVEHARYGEISAKDVDNANMLRHKRKKELQKKYFNNDTTEYKT